MPDLAVCACVILLSVVMGVVLIEDYGQLGRHSPDAAQYLRMAAGDPVPDPYANRVLAPALAGALPGSPETGFRILSFASLTAALVASAVLSLRTGASRGATATAVVLGAASPAVSYILANPFLTDAPAAAAGSIAAVAFVFGAWPVFLMALVAAVGFRDATAALAFVWLPERQVRHLALSVALCLAVVGLCRVVAEPNGSFVYVGMPSWSRWMADLVRSWGPLWLAAGAGLLAVRSHRERVVITAGVLFTTGIGLTFIFNDTERMVLPLLPVVVVGTAHLLDRATSRVAPVVLVLAVSATPMLAFRNVVVPETSLLRTSEAVRIGVLLVGLAAVGQIALGQARMGHNARWSQFARLRSLRDSGERVNRPPGHHDP